MGRTLSPWLRVTSVHHFSCADQAGCPAWPCQDRGLPALWFARECSCSGTATFKYCCSLKKIPFKFILMAMERFLKKDSLHGQSCLNLLCCTHLNARFLPSCNSPMPGCPCSYLSWCPVQLYHLRGFKLKIGTWFLRSDTGLKMAHEDTCRSALWDLLVYRYQWLPGSSSDGGVYNGNFKMFSRFPLDCWKVPFWQPLSTGFNLEKTERGSH